jgi:tRNA-splicing ligase RtcB
MEARCGHLPGGIDKNAWDLAYRNIGTLGGGNHFIEIQKGSDGFIWIMIHSGSRNLGYRIAEYYHRLAFQLNQQQNIVLPDSQLAFLTADSQEGVAYIRDMLFALDYARENRMAIIQKFKSIFLDVFKNSVFTSEINIHHNYASLEKHFGEELWIHRKGATSARVGEKGIIPGSMGTSSYIVEGLGNPESFASCSHGAGRKMGRAEACRTLDKHECDKAMSGIVFDGFKPARSRFGRKSKKNYDLEEAPQAYKNIDEVITAQLDLIKPIVKLFPIGVLKG